MPATCGSSSKNQVLLKFRKEEKNGFLSCSCLIITFQFKMPADIINMLLGCKSKTICLGNIYIYYIEKSHTIICTNFRAEDIA